MKYMTPSNLLYLFFFFVLPSALLEASSSYDHHHDNNLKSMHFSLYVYNNKTKIDDMIYQGRGGPTVNDTSAAAPFGSIFIIRDALTLSPNQTSSSNAVGTVESFLITNTIDGLSRMAVVRYTIDMEGHKGSISMVGAGSSVKPVDAPIVGGTGDFMFVQGYVTYSIISSNPKDLSTISKSEFHLFWPPYAALRTKD